MAEAQKETTEKATETKKEDERPVCGIIMPISGIEGTCYSAQHWEAVRDILEHAVRAAGLEPRMVSDSDPTAIIQRNIVNNLYYNNIVVCDVSSKNPNVMFELGMRLAFDKPVVIVKDDATDYTFDIGIIQHIPYTCHLAYHDTLKFINELAKKIKDTYPSADNAKYSFLQHFGNLKARHLETKDINSSELLLKLINKMDDVHSLIKKNEIIPDDSATQQFMQGIDINLGLDDRHLVSSVLNKIRDAKAGSTSDALKLAAKNIKQHSGPR